MEKTFELTKRWHRLGYALIPFVIFIRVFYASSFLYIGIFLSNQKLEFGKIFKIALIADFVYVLAAFLKLVSLIFFKEVSTLDDLQFQPLSILEILN